MLKRLTQPESAPPWSFWTALATFIALFAALVIGTTIVQIMLDESAAALMTGWGIGMVLTILFVLVSRRRSPEEFAALRISTTPNGMLLLLLLGISVAILFDLISWAAVGDQTLASAELLNFTRSTIDLGSWLVALLFMALLQPAAEELVFRGVMFPVLRAVGGTWTGLLMCAGFHAAFHFMAYAPPPDNQRVLLWYGLVLPFLDALFITGVRAYTGSTRAAMVAHAALGLFAVLKVYTLTG